jgi:hypothetical protein
MNIKELESKHNYSNLNSYLIYSDRRMQNRESAVRSRLRKRYYQDELEEKIQKMEDF